MADILIIDDDEMMVELISELLADEGYTVRAAADGVLGLEEVSRRAPDLILLDMNMPVLDGYAVATRLRDAPELRKPLIVAVTGDTTPAATEAILACGCAAIVPKPLDSEQLIACVADLLAQDVPARSPVGSHETLNLRPASRIVDPGNGPAYLGPTPNRD